MSVAVVITSAQLKSDGYIYATGTVAGGQPLNVSVAMNTLLGMTAAQVQLYLALLLVQQNGGSVLASLEGTVNV
jgi:hypothetical protein